MVILGRIQTVLEFIAAQNIKVTAEPLGKINNKI